jgi:hypothetical protein
MPSHSETGHAKNVANFEDLISFCKGYAATYNPSKDAHRIDSIVTQLANAQTTLQQVKTKQTAFNNNTNSRMLQFKPLKPLATKIINALDATDASAETVKDARTINRKIQGQRATPKVVSSPPLGELEGASDKTISTSQQSYDQQIEHFSKLIELLVSDSNYNPNENDLKVTTNQAKLDLLKAANTAVIDSYTEWSNSRINRNAALYSPLTGIVNTALDIKKYIKSIFGATSPQYKQVSKLEFKNRKD